MQTTRSIPIARDEDFCDFHGSDPCLQPRSRLRISACPRQPIALLLPENYVSAGRNASQCAICANLAAVANGRTQAPLGGPMSERESVFRLRNENQYMPGTRRAVRFA